MKYANALSSPLLRTLMLAATVASLTLSGCSIIVQSDGHENRIQQNSDFTTYLDPWGAWIDHPRFGQVWRPDVGSQWVPFSIGNWIWTDQNWFWSSYEPFGWLVYHYGNWYHDFDYGWFWVPGETWSPATVNWVTYGDYIAWAPAPPVGLYCPNPWEPAPVVIWNIIEMRDFTRENVGEFRVNHPSNPPNQRLVIRHYPDVKTINRGTKQTLNQLKITRESTSFGKKKFYRTLLPTVEKEKVDRHQDKSEKETKPAVTPQPDKKERENSDKDSKKSEGTKDKKKSKTDKKSDEPH